jgi:hypothetical protein
MHHKRQARVKEISDKPAVVIVIGRENQTYNNCNQCAPDKEPCKPVQISFDGIEECQNREYKKDNFVPISIQPNPLFSE